MVQVGEGCGDGVRAWWQLYRSFRPAARPGVDADEDEESHNSEMIRCWVDAYLRPCDM